MLTALNFYRDRKKEFEFLVQNPELNQKNCGIGFTHPFLNSSVNHEINSNNLEYERVRPIYDALHDTGAISMITAHGHPF